MNSIDIVVADDTVCDLGECPLWDRQNDCMYWIDSLRGRIFRSDFRGQFFQWSSDQKIGSIALHVSGGLLCALETGIWLLDLVTGRFELVCQIGNIAALTRLNDGKCDREGTFWVGTLSNDSTASDAALYAVRNGSNVIQVFDRVGVSNGLAFPENSSHFFHSDSRKGCVYKVQKTGPKIDRFERELFFQTDPSVERPDGAAMDTDGCYWSALYGGGAVIRVSPSGEEILRIPVPTSYPTMVCFGNEDLDTVFVTTAKSGTMAPATTGDRIAGKLLKIKVPATGLREPMVESL